MTTIDDRPAQQKAKKPAAKKSGGKKAKQAEPEKKGPDVVGLGTELTEAFKPIAASWKPKSVDGVKATVAALKSGKTPSNAALAKLRDVINETSAAAREQEADQIAKQLSQLNRLVRRLERSTR